MVLVLPAFLHIVLVSEITFVYKDDVSFCLEMNLNLSLFLLIQIKIVLNSIFKLIVHYAHLCLASAILFVVRGKTSFGNELLILILI